MKGRTGGLKEGNAQNFANTWKGPNVQKTVTLNELGRRIGESHPRAKLTDAEVDLVLELLADGMSLAQVAEKMDVSKSCIAHISSGRRRGQLVDRIVSVAV